MVKAKEKQALGISAFFAICAIFAFVLSQLCYLLCELILEFPGIRGENVAKNLRLYGKMHSFYQGTTTMLPKTSCFWK